MGKRLSFPKEQMKIVLTENIHGSATETFEKEGFKTIRLPGSLSTADLIKEAGDAHILGIRSKTQLEVDYFKEASRLLAVGCFCIGTNQVQVEDAGKSGVPVFNAPFSNTRSVAELVLAEVVMLARRLFDRSRLLREGRWLKSARGSYEIRGKTLGIVGYGHIGSQVSVLAESFGMRVLYHDIVTKMPIGNSRQVANLQELLTQSDFVSFHVPETPATIKMMGLDQIRLMKKDSYLLNLSRGSVVVIEDLVKALKDGHLAGCAIDVFPEEPKKNDDIFKSELQELDNVILTPHIGGSTEEAQFNIGIEVATSLIRFIDEGATTGAVNFPQVDLPIREDRHRILNIHQNKPGVLAEINAIISEVGANIQGQQLSTDPNIGYLIMDLDKSVSEIVKEKISALPTSIKTRILF